MINKAAVPRITPIDAIMVIILIALFPLLANRYLLAMYNGKFKWNDSYCFFRFGKMLGSSIGFTSSPRKDLSISSI